MVRLSQENNHKALTEILRIVHRMECIVCSRIHTFGLGRRPLGKTYLPPSIHSIWKFLLCRCFQLTFQIVFRVKRFIPVIHSLNKGQDIHDVISNKWVTSLMDVWNSEYLDVGSMFWFVHNDSNRPCNSSTTITFALLALFQIMLRQKNRFPKR